MEKKRYIDGPFGQIHLRIWGELKGRKPVLLCLPPSPFSSVAYTNLAPFLTDKYDIVSLDYPGFGQSNSCPKPPTINDFAKVTLAVINELFADQMVDILGFHTGTLVAAEASLLNGENIGNLILVDVAFFSPKRQDELKSKDLAKLVITPELSMLSKAWDYTVTNRLNSLSLNRAFELFVDQINAGEQGDVAYNAAFAYACHDRFAEVKTPTTVIATNAGLYKESCAAAQTITGSNLVEIPEITVSVLEQAAELLANRIMNNC